jgi:hypothetical protein
LAFYAPYSIIILRKSHVFYTKLLATNGKVETYKTNSPVFQTIQKIIQNTREFVFTMYRSVFTRRE